MKRGVLILRLRVNFGIAINLRGTGNEEAGLCAFGKAKHVQGTHEGGLNGLNSIELIMRR